MKTYKVVKGGLSRRVGEKFTDKELECCTEHAGNTQSLVTAGFLKEVGVKK